MRKKAVWRQLVLACLACFLNLLPGSAKAAELVKDNAASVEVRLGKDGLSVKAKRAEFAVLAAEVGRVCEFEIRMLAPATAEPTDLVFSGLSVQDGILRGAGPARVAPQALKLVLLAAAAMAASLVIQRRKRLG